MRLEADDEVTLLRPGHLEAEPWRGAIAGSVAAGVALGIGELVAAFGPTLPSLVVGVGGWIIDRSPGWVTRTAIDLVGTSNKPLLITGIVLVTLAVGAWVGRRAIRHHSIGIAAFTAFGLIGALAASGEPGADLFSALTVAVLAASVGIGTLLALLVVGDGRLPLTARQAESPTDPHASRRSFLGLASAAGTFGALTAAGGRRLAASSAVEAARSEIVLPPAATTAPTTTPPLGAHAEIPGISPLYTPNDQFFRIDTALTVPQVDPDHWSLTLDGLVDQPFSLTFDELSAMPLVEVDVTLACVSNEVGGHLVGTARWLGVPLTTLLERAGVRPDAQQVVGRSVDGFTAGFPLAVLGDERPALVAIGMNGEPLPLRHGFPARLVVSGLYGYVSATKWLERIELTTWEGFDGYWIPRGWSKEGPIHTQARIDVPRDNALVGGGPIPIAGVAWAPSRGVVRVEVQVDDGPWLEAELSDPIGPHAWRQWLVRWDAESGDHTVRVRTTDGTGEVQTAEARPPAPSGATGRHEIRVQVS
jgi:DMSO/TMAO reductase YedYZ molybdopterin-dependent catalytic subunit